MTTIANTTSHRRSVVVAMTTLVLGVTGSLAINIKAVSLSGSAPGGAYVSAVAWPIALFLSIELLIHTPWMRTWRDALTKGAIVVLVGFVAAYVSYFHGAHVLSTYGYDELSRYLGPLAIDGAMALATLSLNRVGHARRQMASVATDDTVAIGNAPMATDTEMAIGHEDIVAWHMATDEELGQEIERMARLGDNSIAGHEAVIVSAMEDGRLVEALTAPAPAPSVAPAFKLAPWAQEAAEAVAAAKEQGAQVGDTLALLATKHGTSARTVRRHADAWRKAQGVS